MDVSPSDANRALAELTALRATTRRAVTAPWLPMVVFGGLYVGGGTLLLEGLRAASGLLWLIGTLVGMALIARFYRVGARRSGVSAPRRLELVGVVGVSVCLGVAIATGSVLAPMVVVCAAYLMLAWLESNPIPAVTVTLALAVALALSALRVAPGLQQITFGALLAGGGVILCAQRRWR